MHHWDIIGISLLVLLVACAVGSAFLGFFSPLGLACNIVGYLSLLILIILAINGKKLQRRPVQASKPGNVDVAKPKRTVKTEAGDVALVAGSAG